MRKTGCKRRPVEKYVFFIFRIFLDGLFKNFLFVPKIQNLFLILDVKIYPFFIFSFVRCILLFHIFLKNKKHLYFYGSRALLKFRQGRYHLDLVLNLLFTQSLRAILLSLLVPFSGHKTLFEGKKQFLWPALC